MTVFKDCSVLATKITVQRYNHRQRKNVWSVISYFLKYSFSAYARLKHTVRLQLLPSKEGMWACGHVRTNCTHKIITPPSILQLP